MAVFFSFFIPRSPTAGVFDGLRFDVCCTIHAPAYIHKDAALQGRGLENSFDVGRSCIGRVIFPSAKIQNFTPLMAAIL